MYQRRNPPVSSVVIMLLVLLALMLSSMVALARVGMARESVAPRAGIASGSSATHDREPAHTVAAQADATSETTTLTPSLDTYITNRNPAQSFFNEPELFVTDVSAAAVIDAYTLVRFTLPDLPQGTIIDRATLTLFQEDGSGIDWTIGVAQITEDWNAKATWENQPKFACCAAEQVSKADDKRTTWDVTNLVRRWVYDPAVPNYGMMILGRDAATFQTLSRTYSAAEGAQPPQLRIAYTPPPAEAKVPVNTNEVKLNGSCDTDNEYQGAARQLFLDHDNQVGHRLLEARHGKPLSLRQCARWSLCKALLQRVHRPRQR